MTPLHSSGFHIIGRFWGKFCLINSLKRSAAARLTLYDVAYNANDKASHYSDIKMGPMASQITSLTIVYSTVYSGADHRKHQSSASLAFVRVIHRWPVNSPHKGPVKRKMFPFDDVIMLRSVLDLGGSPLVWGQCGTIFTPRYFDPIGNITWRYFGVSHGAYGVFYIFAPSSTINDKVLFVFHNCLIRYVVISASLQWIFWWNEVEFGNIQASTKVSVRFLTRICLCKDFEKHPIIWIKAEINQELIFLQYYDWHLCKYTRSLVNYETENYPIFP